MKHPIFFLFFVLATISVIHATPHGLTKRATQFTQCVTFDISGTAPIDITEAAVEVVIYDDNDYYLPVNGNVCELYKHCPVKKDTEFDFQFLIKPKDLPQNYHIDVWIHNATCFAL
ncbi:2190_t:CDS:2 [Paraglomus occultum]|uniref:2190_t:CDS:1 n=1 Tax=Paraglomus occultum TaxID=144539 RepID=A0A9N8VPD7_9GLOM|nr:2190_t:CDS:2 [Paraglomus occultum]